MRGVYCAGGLTPSAADRVQIAHLAVGRDLPAGFHTAAQLHAFGVLDDGRTHLIGTEAQDHQPRHNLIVHSSVVSPSVVEVDGVPTASAARCAVDLARTHGVMDGLAVLDAALSRGLTRDELRAELVQHSGLRGAIRARSLVELANPLAESPQESRLRIIAIASGLPVPTCQIPVSDQSGWVRYRLDLGWEELKVAAEYDGTHHADQPFLRSDRTRQNWLTGQGWRLLFFTDVDVYRTPAATAVRMRDELRTAARISGVADPMPQFQPIKELWSLLKIN
jgi:hypothetical protein